ncbi:hypothetical protein PAXRUDRAFT_827078 [Paxillus rubicundulus Ve08.2h10]|uniref:Uncharacterized protein n=1 Tax=Paxillus rubicundulus Ve08.2h10 TaxID=930991 RepID=A0A0D0DYP7_9AGAM|nr:hypothetical protein PAXRUDRAFT_827078 [Paxillus rubicundulus Ve08.2h10]
MTPVPGREALEAMKRVDIQKLCKDYGVKANLKTEALIDLLLDASRPQPPWPNPSQLPQESKRPPSTRIPSLAGGRLRGQSSSSVIIHGSDDEPEELNPRQPPRTQPQQPPVPQPPGTRKARQTQYRLGVGRPVIAGGSGARAVTKTASVSRTVKRAKISRTVQPSEATITEEPEPEVKANASSLDPKNVLEQASNLPQPDALPMTGPSSKPVEMVVAEALAPVQQELDSHKAQLTDLKDKVSSMIESFEAKIRHLTLEVENLRTRTRDSPADSRDISMVMVQDRPVRIPEPPSTPKRVRSPYCPSFALPMAEKLLASELSSDSSGPDVLIPSDSRSANDTEQLGRSGSLLPGFPHSTLGKRPRDSSPSSPTGMFELGQEEQLTEAELESKVGRPAPKRVKLYGAEDKGDGASSSPDAPRTQPPDPSGRPHVPSFTIFSGREEDSLPPIECLSNFYGPTSPPLMSAPATSSANNAENQNAFNFSFLPIASTPAQVVYPLTMGTFPHPEPPTSPSPAVNADRPGSRHSDRFGAFSAPRSSSRASGRAASGGSQGRGEASGSGGLQRVPSSNDVASGLGLTAIRTSATEQGTPAPPAKRTMYGTELEGDTRFGDFGVDGVASGFWAGGRF